MEKDSKLTEEIHTHLGCGSDTIQEIFHSKNTRVFSAEKYYKGSATPRVNEILEINNCDYVILLAIEERVDWGRDHQPVEGALYKLIITDDQYLISKAKLDQKILLEKSKQLNYKNLNQFERNLKEYLEQNEVIDIKVSFQQKDLFKNSFSGRSIWNVDKKQWQLKHQWHDFNDLEKVNDYMDLRANRYRNKLLSIFFDQKENSFSFVFTGG